ncbi:MAG: PAS domain S-box protein [Proteobacteria bacterium]|nr:PAS domain S-box protein [Pseudomonadota bacterium]
MTKINDDRFILEIDNLSQELKKQKEIEKKLRLKLEFFNLLFETLPNPVFYKDEKGRYLGCNMAFESFTGKDRAQIIGKTVYDMGPKELADKYHEMDTRLFEKKGSQQYEWRVKTATGKMRDVIFNKAALVNEDDSIAGLVGIITDITHRKLREEAVKVSEEKFKKISSSAHDAIVQMNDRGEIIFWNAAAQKIFGYTWEEVKGKDLHQLLVPPRYMMAFQNGFTTFKKYGQGNAVGKTVELSAVRKDGSEFEVELSLSSYQEHGIWNAVGIIRDISDRKQIEKEKEKLIIDLKNALNEIKTLKGIVPICASCKKIRDDKGFWNHLETYIQKHSDAQFSHGICPDCKKKLYPDYV